MSYEMKKIIMLFLLSSLSFAAGRDDNSNLSLPKIDKRVELLSIVFRLAGNYEYNMDMFKNYVKDIHDYFDKYKDHPLIVFASKLRDTRGVGFDAVMKMAVHINQPPELDPIIPFTSLVPEPRWGKENAEKFIVLLKQFYIDTNCEDFFKQHDDMFLIAQERFKIVYDHFDVGWYNKFYGTSPKGSFNILIGLGNGGGNYGAKIVYPDNKEDVYAIMGTWTADSLGNPIYRLEGYLPTLIHEFNHSYVNHLIEGNAKEFENSGKILFEQVKDNMKRQAYPNWQIMMNEALVRASVISYLKSHNSSPSEINCEIETQIGKGFTWMKELVAALEFYENNRDEYPTLESFITILVSFYDDLTLNTKAPVE